MLRVLPNHEDGVQDWNEEFRDISKLFRLIGQLFEELSQCRKILVVLIRFRSGSLDFLLEFAEWTGVGRFVLFQELKDFLNSL
jgi:hypothetical protein